MSQEVQISKLSTDGRGLAFVEGKVIFVAGALPGETVTLTYTKQKRQYDEAKIAAIKVASPERVTPPCAVFGVCGGCSLQHLQPEAQIRYKEQWLREMLEKAGLSAQNWLTPLQAKTLGYRHKARLGVRFVAKKNEVLVGFREAETNFITNTPSCKILPPCLGEHLQELKQVLTTLSIKQDLAQIEVAVADQGVALVFRHLKPMGPDDLAKIIALAQQHQWLIYLQSGGLETIQQVYPETPVSLSYTLPLSALNINRSVLNRIETLKARTQLQLNFQPQDFIQVNPSLNELMLAQALALLDVQAEEQVLDLFCGLGNFSLALALYAKKVIGVEGSEAMTHLAAENAARNGLNNTHFYRANLFEPEAFGAFAEPVDKLLLDPPRAGAEMVVRNINLWQPKRILYVSCHAATLVRDLAILVQEHGYRLQNIGVMDMFPHTSHVESMALLVKP